MEGNNIIIIGDYTTVVEENSSAKKIKLGVPKLEEIKRKGYKIVEIQGKKVADDNGIHETLKVVAEPINNVKSGFTKEERPVLNTVLKEERPVLNPVQTAITEEEIKNIPNEVNWQKEEIVEERKPYSAKRIENKPVYPFEASPIPAKETYFVKEDSINKKPYSFETSEVKQEEPAAKKPYSFETPEVKPEEPIANANSRANRSEEFRKMQSNIADNTMRGMVLGSGISRLDAIEDEKRRIATSIKSYGERLKELEQEQKVVSNSAKQIDDMLSMTQSISLEDIRKAQQGDYSSTEAQRSANDAFSRIKEEIEKIKEAKEQEENKLLELESERKRLESERANAQTKLRSAETEEGKICDDIAIDLQTAERIEKLQAEANSLKKQLSLKEETPKRANAFDRMRDIEEGIGAR